MSDSPPITYVWDGDALVPQSPHWARMCAKYLVIGQEYTMEERNVRSQKTHAHYFARIEDAWSSLPPLQAERFQSPEHLRRWALIQAGFSNSQSMTCGTPAAAKRFAAFIRPLDEFSVVTITGSVVNVFTAKSQSYKTMDKKTFAASKDAVLDILAGLIGVTAKELSNSDRAAA